MTVPPAVPPPLPPFAPLSDPLPRLIATDLDRTLLTSQGEVSARTRNALDAASAAGIHVVPATARNPVGLRHLQPILGFDQWALCSNGAFGIHLTSGELLFSTELDPAVLRHVTSTLTYRISGVRFAAIRDAGEQFSAESGYSALTSFTDHMRDPASMSSLPLAEVTESPALKLVFRHPEMSAPELYALASDLVRHGVINNDGFEMTLSGAPFVELMAAGVSKASGLAALCHHLAIDRREVIAFGDGLNDLDMLAWAGTGVAVANADPEVIAAADIVTASHDEDGVALVIEDLLTRSAHGDTGR